MAKVQIINASAQPVGEIELSDDVFGVEVKPHLHWEVVRNQLANRRQGTHSVKTRGTVGGTTKKVYKQKGTGNARHGSQKSPIYVGGGVAHGPHPRDYSYKVPKKVARAALCSALSTRLASGDLLVVSTFGLTEPKTKEAAAILGRMNAPKALVVAATEDRGLHLSMRNLPSHKYIRAEGVNVFDVLKYDKLVLTVEAVRALEERLQA